MSEGFVLVHMHIESEKDNLVKTKPKQVFFFHFSSFLTVYLLFKCRFVV